VLCYDKNRFGRHTFMGKGLVSLASVVNGVGITDEWTALEVRAYACLE